MYVESQYLIPLLGLVCVCVCEKVSVVCVCTVFPCRMFSGDNMFCVFSCLNSVHAYSCALAGLLICLCARHFLGISVYCYSVLYWLVSILLPLPIPAKWEIKANCHTILHWNSINNSAFPPVDSSSYTCAHTHFIMKTHTSWGKQSNKNADK